jgi:hypothetical protein
MRSLTCPAFAGTPCKSQGLEKKYRENTWHEVQDDAAGEGKDNRE